MLAVGTAICLSTGAIHLCLDLPSYQRIHGPRVCAALLGYLDIRILFAQCLLVNEVSRTCLILPTLLVAGRLNLPLAFSFLLVLLGV